MIIMKFGGSSIKDAEAIERVATIVEGQKSRQPLVVLSALGGVTDQLIEAHRLSLAGKKEEAERIADALVERHQTVVDALLPSGPVRDQLENYLKSEYRKLRTFLNVTEAIKVESSEVYNSLIGLGELFSTHIFEAYLRQRSNQSICLDVRPIMQIHYVHGEPTPNMDKIGALARLYFMPLLNKGQLVVTQGFLATTVEGAPATLGRDGSDYTASILGAVLQADEIQIWSDVDGILSADPTIIPEAKPLTFMTFDEACELAYFGARVLHPATIQPAVSHGIPVRVLNAQRPQEKGTLIMADNQRSAPQAIRSIAYKEGISLVTIESSKLLLSAKLIEEIFETLTKHGKKVYAVNKAATKLSVTLQSNGGSVDYLKDLERFGQVELEANKVVVSVVGERMKGDPQITWQIIRLLHEQGIRIELISQFSKQISLMFIIDEKDIEQTVHVIHENFIKQNEAEPLSV